MPSLLRKTAAAAMAFTLVAQPVLAQSRGRCLQPAERVAFDVGALKSQLMVIALTCNAHERYNAFVLRYRPQLVAEERVQTRYFGRAGGRRAQDDYITNLANHQSQQGIRRGTLFCQEQTPLFDRVMAIRNVQDLGQFASGNQQPTIMTLAVCGAPVTPRTSTSASAPPGTRTAATGSSATR